MRRTCIRVVTAVAALAIALAPVATAKQQSSGPTKPIDYALRLAHQVYGTPYYQLRAVSHCESIGYTDFYNGPGTTPPASPTAAQRDRATGLFQFLYDTWMRTPYGRAGYDRMNHLANALAAAWLWKHDGRSWREWDCQP